MGGSAAAAEGVLQQLRVAEANLPHHTQELGVTRHHEEVE
jgi:hypothetical protein